MTHRNAVANADCGNEHRRASRRIYARLDGGGNLIQIDMSGHYFAVRRYDCYKRLFQFFVRKTARLEQRTLGRGFGPSDKIITTKFHISSIGRKMRPPP